MADFLKLQLAHINLGNARAASAQLTQDMLAFNYDIVPLNEPYTIGEMVVGFPLIYCLSPRHS